MMLVGDIGGTKTVLAIAAADGNRTCLTDERRYASAKFATLEDIVRRFIEETGHRCNAAAFAVAGPVRDDRSEITNLPWTLDARHMEHDLGLPKIRLLNDLEAIAWSIPVLDTEDLEVLHPGEPDAVGNACVVAAGTGLGQAGMYWDGSVHHPFATEGGHADFPPRDEREMALLRHLKARFGHVSVERVVSGRGIANIYGFLLEWHETQTSPELREAMSNGDQPPVIASAAARGACPLCVETMQLFAELYGREAANAALKHMALGGVYLAGGIAPKNLDLLRRGPFLRACFDKGRMSGLLQRIPIKVIRNLGAPLLGAARFLAER